MKLFALIFLINLVLLINGVISQCLSTDETPQIQNLVKSFLDFLRNGGQTQQTVNYIVNSTFNYHVYVSGSEKPYTTFVQNPVPYPIVRNDATDSPIVRLAPITPPNQYQFTTKRQKVKEAASTKSSTSFEPTITSKTTTTSKTTVSYSTMTESVTTSKPVGVADDGNERISMASMC